MSFIYSVLGIMRKSFALRVWYVHGIAALTTYFFVVSGFDWQYFLFVQRHMPFALLIVTDIIGLLVPFCVPLIWYLRGKKQKNRRVIAQARALFATVVATFLIVLLYKSLTGRVSPPEHGSLIDTSAHFNFGFMREQVIGGWPSSHTAIAFAMAMFVSLVLPRRFALRAGLFFYALIIGLGVSIGWHWFSEFFAGALIGSLVGYVSAKGILSQE